ncbi:MAG: prepilin-type N-terminal cleavage/methylation domain-containing protein [Cyanobacteria bacterium P01_C01_bin.120]
MSPAVFQRTIYRLRRAQLSTQRGFTLLELLVAILIGGIITSALLFLVIEMLSVSNREESLTQTQQNMRRAIDFITRDVSEAAFVYSDFTSSYDLLAQLDDEPTGPSVTPVLAFWRLDALTNDEVDDLGTFCAAQTGDVLDECEALLVRQSTYTLVVYFHEENAPGDIWEGQTRIVRYELPAYSVISTSALTRNPGYGDPTLLVPNVTPDSFNSFDDWRKASGETTQGTATVLTDYVNTIATDNTTACPSAGFVRTPANNDSFYACVAQPSGVAANNAEVNKSLIVYLQGNASRGAADQVVGTSEASSLPKLESQVLIRGVIQNDPG